MNNSFKESFNYFAAFLAVLFGLSAFKTELVAIKFKILGVQLSIIDASIPFIILMVLATYFAALTMASRSITFRFFPLTKYLEQTAYSLAYAGLIYPVILTFVCIISLIASNLAQFDERLISNIAALLGTLVGVAAAYRTATLKLNERYEVKLAELRKIAVETETINSKKTSSFEIVMLYHQLITLSKSILSLYGYPVSGENSIVIGKMLTTLKIFNKQDLKKIKKLSNFRNKLLHSQLQLQSRDSEIKIAREELEILITKLKKVILMLGRDKI